ncbi:DegT/DnrJ/EryC1/StrS family aminotransferase [Merismopedia glauca]|uniref:Cys/Met metabolism pyridoxal-phosphate-dependent enzyme n=1 Tax=Merismopedia glauca CCAP 1448/3 TaxID=1296344 RepID=A0A2T1C597_9CYAN|nr:DegT/DnrJ/EryC1/StrS family aminotransferase [Merismopedia glauca]PSB03317.1 Cys/Met metabolism pyridoxal-phosphate-dependent enzyme [Merismopedia glauca CCAP 1448/3]
MSNIPPLDLSRQYQLIGKEVEAAVGSILASGRYIGGSMVENFEREFANYIGVSHCVSCNSGTDALYLALRSLNIGAGDEVITTPFTFIATSETIAMVGATPVFVDIDPATFNIDVSQIAKAISSSTKAIIPVHLFGQPTDMTAIMEIAKQYNLFVIEDCAQATGAKWGEARVGSIGHIGCFSFFPTKNLGACGDGGAVTTGDEAIAAKIRMLKEHGSKARYYHEENGVNSRLDALQAAILQIKLQHLDTWNAQRHTAAEIYHQLLAPVSAITIPPATNGGTHVWNQYTIKLKAANNSEKDYREQIRQTLQAKGVSSMIYYPLPLHQQSVYKHLGYQPNSLPHSELVAHQVLSLPMFPEISQMEQEQVVYSLKDSL